ncbi:hypothetical protein FRC04_002460 [Tulasnella sp. 424]|nr:hypothetical protein FRC04_002460 [Tulasnella sp. 424]KAG8967568.1 hypothetical protein FRC05_002001 [Tulasnella sp. 425]
MDGTELPQFRGTDAKECEEFIAAVVKHAYNQGKLRDDEWIADFAASCFVHDALRWWSWLDEETQGSWKMLRQAMFSRYRPLFHGKNGEEAEQFVFSVRQRALDAGKENDNDWIIASVSGSFIGNALRWHVSLDSSIRKNWELLEVAILAQYPGEGQSGPLLKYIWVVCGQKYPLINPLHPFNRIPTPAAAALAPPRTKSRGRIRLLKKNDSTISYLSKSFSNDRIGLTTSLSNALEVEYNPSSSSPHQLLIPDGQIPNYDALGARWNLTDITKGNRFVASV